MLQVGERVVVGRLGDVDTPPGRLAVDARAGAGGEHRLPAARERVAELDTWGRPVDIVERARVAIEKERLVVVVHREGPARIQVSPDRRHRLLCEEVVLEPKRALPCEQRQRVGQREQDEVVVVLRLLDEGAPVIDVDAHARVLVRPARMERLAERLDLGIDLDGVDVLRALGERDGDVVAVAGSDDQHVVERPGDVSIGKEVEALDLRERRQRVRGLVRNVVRADREGVARQDAADAVRRLLVGRSHLVVRRPVVVAVRRLDGEQRDNPKECEHMWTAADEDEQKCRRDRPPRDRRRLKERERREHDDARDRSENVQAVRIEWAEANEDPSDPVTDRSHHGDGQDEDRCELHPARECRPAECAVRRSVLEPDRNREEQDEADEYGESDGRPREEVRLARGAKESDADAEEACE